MMVFGALAAVIVAAPSSSRVILVFGASCSFGVWGKRRARSINFSLDCIAWSNLSSMYGRRRSAGGTADVMIVGG